MDMYDIKDKLIEIVGSVFQKDIETIDTHELGEVMDMIKDIAEAIEKCKKAEYYETVTETMKSADTAKIEDFRNRMYFSEVDETKSIDDVINSITEMSNNMDANEIMSVKQKLVSLANKL